MFDLIKLGLPKSKSFGLGLLLSVLQGLSAVALLATSAWLISRAAEHPPVMYLMIAVVGVRGFALGRSAFRYAERILLHDAAFRMLSATRPRIFRKLIPFAPAGLGLESRGDILTKIGSDTDSLQNLPLRVIAPLVQSLVVSFLTVLGMAFLLPSAALILLATLLVAVFVALPISSAFSKQAERKHADTLAKHSGQSLDYLEQLDVLVAYGWVDSAIRQLRMTDDVSLVHAKQKALSAGVGQALFSITSTLATIGTSYFGAQSVSQASQPGVLLAVFVLIPLALFDVILNLQPVMNSWRTYKASALRILEIETRDIPEVLSPGFGSKILNDFTNLELIEVSLAYPTGGAVLEKVSLKLSAGETLAITGPSGSGKSTLALALVRFLGLQSGSYLINGNPIDEYSEDSVHKTIGLVEQNPNVFLGTVRDNLLLAKPDSTDEELWQALQIVGLHETFSLRQGLATELGDRGVLISGGEAQRLALARALLANFSVIILDEPTANVDQMSGIQLVSDLLNAAKAQSNRAIVLITHDSNLSAMADRQIIL